MFPYIINTEHFKLATYSVLGIIGILGAILLFRHLTTRDKVADKTYNFYSTLAIFSIVVGLLSSILFQSLYVLFETGQFTIYDAFVNFFNGGDFVIESGMTFLGGLVGGVVTFVGGTMLFAPRQAKLDFWQIANLAAVSIVLAHMIGRLGCFAAGCCHGIKSESIFGVLFPGDLYKVLPTQLYEAIFLGGLLAVLLNFRKHAMLIYLFSYSIFRFCLEFLRGDYRGGYLLGFFSPSQVQSMIMLAAAIALYIYVYRYKKIPFHGRMKGEQNNKLLADTGTENVEISLTDTENMEISLTKTATSPDFVDIQSTDTSIENDKNDVNDNEINTMAESTKIK